MAETVKVIPTNSGDSVERVLDPFDIVEAVTVLKTGRVGRSWGPKLGFMASTLLVRNCRIQRRGRPPPSRAPTAGALLAPTAGVVVVVVGR